MLQIDWRQTFPGGNGVDDGRVYYVDWLTADVGKGKAQGIINLPGGSTVEVNFEAVFEMVPRAICSSLKQMAVAQTFGFHPRPISVMRSPRDHQVPTF